LYFVIFDLKQKEKNLWFNIGIRWIWIFSGLSEIYFFDLKQKEKISDLTLELDEFEFLVDYLKFILSKDVTRILFYFKK
jgi:hypothetical protein